ncbi:MAG: DUF4910 domain-containing protein [Firmicutes bacterium]|jgi:hypothetical protein|nr:DUF4910 domain-containing protein [Bacillota bacterium]
MINQVMNKIKPEISGQKAFNHVAEVSQHHRIQASPGYRNAAFYCRNVFRDSKVRVKIDSYKADHDTAYWTNKLWDEWDCTSATLDILGEEPLRLCDYQAEKMCIIQRSIATPEGGVKGPIIYLEKGDSEEHYEDIDFTGALVLSDGDWNKVRAWAVEKRGAVGIISFRMLEFPPVRHRFDIADAIMYTSFWWTGTEKKTFGFALSPKQGDWLKDKCLQQKEKHAKGKADSPYIMAEAHVDAKLYPGFIENVNAFIPGQTMEEILITAHLCHPQASANDNASGVSVALEAARALQKLIDEGVLEKPRRGIRFLLIPEFTGTYAYLSDNENRIPRTLAGLNLDMVGENQALTNSSLLVEYPPQASGSFVGDLMAEVLTQLASEAKNIAGTASYGLFRYALSPFSGGSDHYITSDPTVGIPSPMLIQWPDKFYHTSADTLDKVDPDMLYRVGVMTATYAYVMAMLNEEDAAWVLNLQGYHYYNRANELIKNLPVKAQLLEEKVRIELFKELEANLEYLYQLKIVEMNDLLRFMPRYKRRTNSLIRAKLTEFKAFNQNALRNVANTLGLPRKLEQEEVKEDKSPVPIRLFRGPFSARGYVEMFSEEIQKEYKELGEKHPSMRGALSQFVYWIDGKRSLNEIIELTKKETGMDVSAYAEDYLNILHKMDLIDWAK